MSDETEGDVDAAEADEEAEAEAQAKKALAFIRADLNAGLETFSRGPSRDALGEALYTFNERGLWEADLEIKETDLAIRIWALVETVRKKGFRRDLRM